jgi:hypothetical protein
VSECLGYVDGSSGAWYAQTPPTHFDVPAQALSGLGISNGVSGLATLYQQVSDSHGTILYVRYLQNIPYNKTRQD